MRPLVLLLALPLCACLPAMNRPRPGQSEAGPDRGDLLPVQDHRDGRLDRLADRRRDGPLEPLPELPSWALAPSKTAVVAASDSSAADKAKASRVCDGSSDQTEIQAAIEEVAAGAGPTAGGRVMLLAGSYKLTGKLDLRSYVLLEGAGADATVLWIAGSFQIYVQTDNVVLRRFGLRDRAMIHISASHVKVHEVTAIDVWPAEHAVFFVPMFYGDRRDIELVRCRAIRSRLSGFQFSGWYTYSKNVVYTLRDVRLIDCEATGCGDGTENGSVGFDVQEDNHLENMLVRNCRADDNWEAGFFQLQNFAHARNSLGIACTRTTNLVLEGCTASRNGIRKRAARGLSDIYTNGTSSEGLRSGSGFFVHTGATVRGCQTGDNEIAGYFTWNANFCSGGSARFENDADTGSTYCFGRKYVNAGVTYSGNLCDGQTVDPASIVDVTAVP